MNVIYSEFKRLFSLSMYKNLKIGLGEMSFSKDFVNDKRGDLYPLIQKDDDCIENVINGTYNLSGGSVKRMFCRFFHYGSYELSAALSGGGAGFTFALSDIEATIWVKDGKVFFSCDGKLETNPLPEYAREEFTLVVSCRPKAFDVYLKNCGNTEYVCTFTDEAFRNTKVQDVFSKGYALLYASGNVCVKEVLSYIDNGISIADIRTVRYENGELMVQQGKIYLTASVRLQEGGFQGVFSWVPGTCEFNMTGALFYDSGDGGWCGDVAASLLYHRDKKLWYLWVCSFSHGHILGHSSFEGDPRFGVNVIDITLMEKAPEGSDISVFKAFQGDEDPDFFYDEERGKWLMAICRLSPETKQYAYVFFESDNPFDGYSFIGKGPDGCETGGSFVKAEGELFFVCGNSFNLTSDYRIYSKDGMKNASFNHPDGGFRGWGTVIPVKLGSRTRYFWLTFDRHGGSDYTWSYGNLYCFEVTK